MIALNKIDLFDFQLENGKRLSQIPLTYQIFGQAIGTAPIVLVNHALTGNSNVIGENGWWNDLIGINKTIDTSFYTIIVFNIPGNGFDGKLENLISNYTDFTIRDIATIFWQGLLNLNISELYAVIGGSLGGAIAWEMTVLRPKSIKNLIPIASDWKATDWMIGNIFIQDKILNNSVDPIADARHHAMLLYRTPQSVNQRFGNKSNANGYEIENWLLYHGTALKNRFTLSAYKLMNHLLKTNNIFRNRATTNEIVGSISSNIHIVAVDTDYFFTPDENKETHKVLLELGLKSFYHEIKSIHGHDAFLIETKQLNNILNTIFKTKKQYNESN